MRSFQQGLRRKGIQALLTDTNLAKQRKTRELRVFYLCIILWLELGYGNITFGDELDFEIDELSVVHEDSVARHIFSTCWLVRNGAMSFESTLVIVLILYADLRSPSIF